MGALVPARAARRRRRPRHQPRASSPGMTGWSDLEPQRHRRPRPSARRTTAAHSGSYHLTHWTTARPSRCGRTRRVRACASGNYKVRAWVRKGGTFDFARLQAKTCGGCAPVSPTLGHVRQLDAGGDAGHLRHRRLPGVRLPHARPRRGTAPTSSTWMTWS